MESKTHHGQTDQDVQKQPRSYSVLEHLQKPTSSENESAGFLHGNVYGLLNVMNGSRSGKL